MQIITSENKISVDALKTMAEKMFGNLVKAVVDVEREIAAVDGELHSDGEVLLTENGSKRINVWGINFYPEFKPEDERFVEFDSMINIKPAQGNRSRGVDNEQTRSKILAVVKKLIAEN